MSAPFYIFCYKVSHGCDIVVEEEFVFIKEPDLTLKLKMIFMTT